MSEQQTAIVFPGQGCQRSGMGQEFHTAFPVAKQAYDEASEAAGLDLARLCFEDDERLGLTEYAQPAILTTEIAMLRALRAEFGLAATYYGGHSLGEYAALVAADALPLGVAVRLVRERGRLMQDAVPVGRGRMVAVIGHGLDEDVLTEAIDGLEVGVANDNSREQVVLSGLADDTRAAERWLTALLDGSPPRFVELDVSAPFHSTLMATIEDSYAAALQSERASFDAERATRVTSNFGGGFHSGNLDELIGCLVRQISGTVRWRANMEALVDRCDRVIEVGPGRPLRAFFKTVGVAVDTVTSVRSAEKLSVGAAPC